MFKGVTMSSPIKGKIIIEGYTRKELMDLLESKIPEGEFSPGCLFRYQNYELVDLAIKYKILAYIYEDTGKTHGIDNAIEMEEYILDNYDEECCNYNWDIQYDWLPLYFNDRGYNLPVPSRFQNYWAFNDAFEAVVEDRQLNRVCAINYLKNNTKGMTYPEKIWASSLQYKIRVIELGLLEE